MLKELVKLKTEDNHTIYGTLERPKEKSDKLIIFVHGLLSSQSHPSFKKATPYFKKENYAVLKFDFYSKKENARSFSSTTIQEQVDDLKNIINYHRKSFENIHLVAHSLGSVVSLLTKTNNIKNIILWEPSMEPKDVFSSSKELDNGDYLFCENKIQRKLITETNSIPNLSKLIRKNNKPVSIITAKDFGDKLGMSLYFKNLRRVNKKRFYIIKNTDHNFNKNTDKVIKQTIKFIKNNEKEKLPKKKSSSVTTKLLGLYKRVNNSISNFQSC